MTTIRLCALVVLLCSAACSDDIDINLPPTAPTPPTTQRGIVEFRVQGDLPLVIVRISNSLDGLTQVSSVLPYSSTLSIGDRESIFLSLDARAPLLGSLGFLHAAIFVDGIIFREASSSALNPVATVSGTWRRSR